jgi:hypothetical protein
MKLAEALAERADAQRRLAQLRQRVAMSARFQEGEQPPEDPTALLEEAESVAASIEDLIRRINRTNAATVLDEGMSLTDALARRDVLALLRVTYAEAAEHASVRQDRYSRSEVKFVTALDVGALRTRIDELSKEYRELDAKIQAKNWEIDLGEA